MMRQLRGIILLLAPATAACGADGIHFEVSEQSLGTITQGEDRELVFPFRVVGAAVRVDELRTSCGCAEPRLLVDGGSWTLGRPLAPGSGGEVRVLFRSAGFEGRKDTGVEVLGEGPGLPAALKVTADIRPWFRVEPSPLRLGVLKGEEDEAREVRVAGPEDFAFTGVLGMTPPLRVEGVPSAAPAREQRFRVIVPAGAEEGWHAGSLRLQADNGLSLVLALDWRVARDLWVIPDRDLLFQAIRPGVEAQATVEVGARTGFLAPPKVRVEGIPGAQAHPVPFGGEDGRYRVLVILPGDLPPGPVSGWLHLDLEQTVDGAMQRHTRRIRITGVVLEPAGSQGSR